VSKLFLQVIIQEKSHDDWRSFCIAKIDGQRWELRGYGQTFYEAAAQAYERFLGPEDQWDLCGYPVPENEEED
jgi:hypothetical protein